MPYSEPKREIIQVFEEARAEGAAPLYPVIVGPLYDLHRYDESDEKAQMGDYHEESSAEQFTWPEHVAGGLIDLETAVVQLEDALIEYYSGSSNAEVTEDEGNRIYSSLIFKTNSAANRTAAAFGSRDVAIGDWAILHWPDAPTIAELVTQVTGFVADVVAGSAVPVEAPYRDVGFGYSSLAEGAVELTTPPTRYTTVYVTTDYNGLIDGYPRDVYTVQVLTVGSTGTGALDGTVLRITSAGADTPQTITLGTDVVYDAGNGWYEISLGTRGALLRLSDAGAGVVTVGSTWTIQIQQTYLQVDVTDDTIWAALGDPTYSGDVNTKYILTVISGGTLAAESPTAADVRIHYRTNNGADTSGYITVAVSDFGSSSSEEGSHDYPIGQNDVLLRFFAGIQFNTGDVWSFSMQAPGEGAIHTLILKDSVDVVTGVPLDLKLLVKDTVEFPLDYLTMTQDYIQVQGSALIESTLLGSAEDMPLIGGTLYADYRELNTAKANILGYVDTQAGRLAELGPSVLQNPLSKAVYHALSEEEGSDVGTFYLPISTNDEDGYDEALDLLTTNDLVYGLVPLTDDEQIKQNFMSHVVERSNSINNQWRMVWLTNTLPQIIDVYTETAAEADLEATVGSYPVGTYRKITGTNTQFVTNGIRPADKLRINYETDLEGVVTYDEYTVDRVNSETELITVEDIGAPLPVAVKIELWRSMTKSEYATELSEYPERFNSRRVISVYCDNPTDPVTEEALDAFYVAAALAGQRGVIPPHAPMSQLDLLSIDVDPLVKFSRSQLNVVAGGGNWIVDVDYNGRVFTRHQVTSITDYADFNKRESSKTTNLDHISRDFLTATADLFGQGNISDDMLSLIAQRITNTIELITNRSYSAKVGPQMLDASILRLERDSVFRDTVIVEIDPSMPDPLNNLPITFRVS